MWEKLALSLWEFWWGFRNVTFSWENFATRKKSILILFTA
jgi:hypothetical protein